MVSSLLRCRQPFSHLAPAHNHILSLWYCAVLGLSMLKQGGVMKAAPADRWTKSIWIWIIFPTGILEMECRSKFAFCSKFSKNEPEVSLMQIYPCMSVRTQLMEFCLGTSMVFPEGSLSFLLFVKKSITQQRWEVAQSSISLLAQPVSDV